MSPHEKVTSFLAREEGDIPVPLAPHERVEFTLDEDVYGHKHTIEVIIDTLADGVTGLRVIGFRPLHLRIMGGQEVFITTLRPDLVT